MARRMKAGMSKYAATVVGSRGAVAAARLFGVSMVAWWGLLPSAMAQETPHNAAASIANERQFTIRTESNLVLVRVVVRDGQGKSVKGLKKSDFQVQDNNEPQLISYFSVEDPASGKTDAQSEREGVAVARDETAMPQRFTAVFFDDYHLEFGDLVQIREAARRYLAENLDRGARVAVFSASGNVHADFTSDREKLDQALSQLRLEPRFRQLHECPNLTGFEAQLIDDGLDRDALAIGIAITVACLCANGPSCPDAESYTKRRATEIVTFNDVGAENTLAALQNLVGRMAKTPGDRTIAMISDGFLNRNRQYLMDALIDRALRANVIINAMDARGLYTTNSISGKPILVPDNLQTELSTLRVTGMGMDSDVMSYVAQGTGGTFVQNSNDFEGAFGKISSLREISYVLGFAPEDLKLDGAFHHLKVKLVSAPHLSVQARRGYWARKQAEDAAIAENEQLQKAIFSQQDMNGLPLHFRTEFVKVGKLITQFSVIVDIDLHSVRFRKEDGRNLDNLTFMLALFDRDGNYVTGQEKILKLHLSDATLRRLEGTGASMTAALDVKPGSYFVRAVVLDDNSQELGTGSETVEIP
jgi:VWFA-related protein